jgi:hypothetical protein
MMINIIAVIVALVLWGYFTRSIWLYGKRQNKTKKIYYRNLSKSEKELDRLLKLEKKWTHMFDSDNRVALALLEEIRKLNQNKNDNNKIKSK